MAEPIVQPDSPLAAYLASVDAMPLSLLTTILSKLRSFLSLSLTQASSQTSTTPTTPPPDISTLLILIGYHLSPRWALCSAPLIALALCRPRTHLRHIPHRNPRTRQLHIQAAIIPEIAKLVNTSQALDLRVSRAIGAVKEIECVALGLRLSNPMPPVSRLETAAFPFAGPSADPAPEDSLHALGLRKVLQRVLDQARHQFENTAAELEAVILSHIHNPSPTSPSSNPSTVSPAASSSSSSSSASSSTLAALMEMYGCSRLDPQTLRGSTNERARRQAWRASLHSRIHDSAPLLSPVAASNDPFQLVSTPPSAKRLSLQQTPLSPSPSPSALEHHLEARRLLAARKPRCRSSFGTPSHSHEYHQLRSIDASSSSPTEHSAHRRSPRPVSFHAASHSPTPAGPATAPDGRRASLLIPVGRSPKPRPSSMSATSSFRTLASSSPISHARRSPDLYPEIHLPSSPPTATGSEEPSSPLVDRVVPFSLLALQNSFERMHVSRKRLMCCLLALDFTLFTPHTLPMWQDTLETVQGLLKTVDALAGELTAGMSVEFGPGSFDTASPDHRPATRDDPSHARRRDSRKLQERGQEEDSGGSWEGLRDFGPPMAEADKKTRRQSELMGQMQAMDLALRTIAAKMKVCVEALGKEGPRAVGVHESIRGDLELLAREWDASRAKIRLLVDGDTPPPAAASARRSRLRPHSLDSSLSIESSGPASSISSSEALTPVGEHAPPALYASKADDNDEEEEEDEGAPLLRTGPRASMAPPPGLEAILAGALPAAVATPPRRSPDTPPAPPTRTLKLSAAELAELTRCRRRESAAFAPRPASLIALHPPAIPATPPPAVVTELKDVLLALKTRRSSTIDSL
ncbi:hypothetical protein PtA15_2A572 [Puccinia triticina]|uniref:Myosin-binding domain-containing protein n=1 Tax=Puccinia triticina TaxID=208348 RepID=A0ABY7CAU5_9BASI|nr:uncharacterized protein PtA15_2A572 [Puccinia triticina]WAQ82255.1 hypothetical protein PtA15_2A572 [Puccinia triticina]